MSAPGLRVLLVEDDPATAELERRTMARTGLIVRVVGTVAEALAVLVIETFDVVLTDYQLPDGAPWPIVDLARSRVPRIPVILVTATGNEAVAAEAIRHGIADYVRKAESFTDLLPEAVERSARVARLEEQNRHLASLVDAADEAIVSRDLNDVITSWNHGAERMLGWTAAEAIGKALWLLPQDTSTLEALERRAWEDRSGAKLETLLERKDGSRLWVMATLTALTDDAGRVIGRCSTARDITARKQAELALARSQAQLAEAQQIAHIGSWEFDPATQRMVWSDEEFRIFGVDPQTFEPSLESASKMVHPDDLPGMLRISQQSLAAGKGYAQEFRIHRPDGATRVLFSRVQLAPAADGEPARLIGTHEDITERKQLQEQLLLSSRLASVGELAAGICHEVNNPLAYVISNVDLALDELPRLQARLETLQTAVSAMGSTDARLWGDAAPAEIARGLGGLRDSLREAREGAGRVSGVMRDLQTFSRAGDQVRGPVPMRRLVEASINLAWNEIRHRARLVKDFAEAPPVEANESRLGQAFLTVLLHLARSMREGNADENELRIRIGQSEQGQVLVAFHATSGELTPEQLGKLFAPSLGGGAAVAGTGLGIARTLVEELGGTLTASAEAGGILLQVSLPSALPVRAPSARQAPAKPPRRRGRVLVIDDEPLILKTLGRVLDKDHDVVLLENAAEALELLRGGARFDVVVCDLMMPEVTGMDLYDALAAEQPATAARMVFVTGGVFSGRAREFLDRISNRRLEKPFDLRLLRAIVLELVAEHAPG